MEAPDVSLELSAEAELRDACFNSVTPLLTSGELLTAAARVATDVALFTGALLILVFAAGLAADFTLFFAVALVGLIVESFVAGDAFFGAGLSVLVMAFASLPATVFSSNFLAGVAAVLFDAALLAAVLLVADFVTVAFIMSSFNELPELFSRCLKMVSCYFQIGSDCLGRRVRQLFTHIAKRPPPLLELKSKPQ